MAGTKNKMQKLRSIFFIAVSLAEFGRVSVSAHRGKPEESFADGNELPTSRTRLLPV